MTIRGAIAVALAATAVTGGQAGADTTMVVATGTAVRDMTDLRSARGVCVATGVGDVALTVLTSCGFADESLGFTSVSAGPVAVATFTAGFGETPESLCWTGYAVPATNPSLRIPFEGCVTVAP